MDQLSTVLRKLFEAGRALLLNPDTVATILALAAFLALMVVVEWRRGGDPRRYVSRHFRTDVAYTVFYTGVYALAVSGPVLRGLEFLVHRYAPSLELNLLAAIPRPFHLVVFLVVTDFIGYWIHRLMHANRFLWAFHQVHHSQKDLTFLTAYRFHFVDTLTHNFFGFWVGLVLGIPVLAWLPLTVVTTWFQSAIHSDTGWSYGALDAVFVSSRFHNIHHSTERAHYDKNFGLLFSSWDVLFGTAEANPTRPPAYGIAGVTVPESFSRQLFFPFLALIRATDRRRSGDLARRTTAVS